MLGFHMDALLSAKRWTLNPSCDHLCVSRGVINWTERERALRSWTNTYIFQRWTFSPISGTFVFFSSISGPLDFLLISRHFWKTFCPVPDSFGRLSSDFQTLLVGMDVFSNFQICTFSTIPRHFRGSVQVGSGLKVSRTLTPQRCSSVNFIICQ